MKKIIYMLLVLSLSLSLAGCESKKEPEEEKEETITMTDENGNEFTYTKSLALDIQKSFSILDEYTWEELKLFDEKERYLWGPEEDYVNINLGDVVIKTVAIHAGVEVTYGDGTVRTYFVDTENENVIMWDDDSTSYVFVEHEK